MTREFGEAAINAMLHNKRLADGAIAQTSDENLHQALDANTNSIAVIMQHVGGNLKSRWSNFLTSDGEKPDRNRDAEFVDSRANREALIAIWEEGFHTFTDSIRSLNEEDYAKTITIRGEAFTVPLAITRSLAHTCYHLGQIVQVARIHAGEKWETLTIPRGGSQQYNQATWGKPGTYRS